MISSKSARSAVIAIAAMLSLATSKVQACAVCFGAPGSDLSESMSLSILFMIGLVAFLLSCLGLFIYTLNRTARRAGPAPMRDEFGADILPAPQTSDH